MRPSYVLVIAASALLLPAIAHATPVPVNPVFDGSFDVYVPLAGDTLAGGPADQSFGVGHQVLGCSHTANLIFSSDCHGQPTNRTAEAGTLASDPQGEVAYWTAPGTQEGDLAGVDPVSSNVFHAWNWQVYPDRAARFYDWNGDGDREARVQIDGAMLYQTFAVESTHSAVPAGTVQRVTFTLEHGAVGGGLNLVLDSFPIESATDYPQAFYNYQLWIPASTWSVSHGTISIDPLQGSLSGPYAGAYLPGDQGGHPTAAQWAAGDAQARHDILSKLRIIQFTLQSLPKDDIVDDVAFELDV